MIPLFAVVQMIGAGILAVVGVALLLMAAIALLRFPDLFTRAHALTLISGAGAMCVLAALGVAHPEPAFLARLALFGLIIIAAGPVIAQAAASAAHAAGLSPLAGAYVAPRPGSERAP